MTTLVWLRRDLRLNHNPALDQALRLNDPVVLCYIDDPEREAPWQPGAASRWYLQESLSALYKSVSDRGLPLHVTSGHTFDVISELVRRAEVKRVYWNRVYEPSFLNSDEALETKLNESGIETQCFHDHALIDPALISNKSGQPYKVFTPFYKQVMPILLASSDSVRKQTHFGAHRVTNDHSLMAEVQIVECEPWHEKLRSEWSGGESAALNQLRCFLESIQGYETDRDYPVRRAVSNLSAALHFGELSPWSIVEALKPAVEGEFGAEVSKSAEAFLRQIVWREFSIHLPYHYPKSVDQPLNPKFSDTSIWSERQDWLESWQKGETGIPLVDAGMNELWSTGRMHNRVRMVAASFLTKNLGQHWLQGAHWFWDTLVDADLANNTMGWQWVAGCGCDAAPYYRIFNPDTQMKRFDPDGEYVNRWLPSDRLSMPVVDLRTSRQAALDRYKMLR